MNLIFCVVWCCLWWSSSATYDSKSYKRLGGIGKPNSTAITRNRIYENKWFEQRLDHFNPTDTRTWKQRYQMNLKYYKRGGPVFLRLGGEDGISHNWINSGAWIEYAEKCNALCFQLEHRYYGRSQPTINASTSNLLYLNIEQALADLGRFINTITSENESLLSNAKWIVFGASYAGSLAAWARMKYPQLVHAAVSSSGTLGAKIDFPDYYMTTQSALSDYNPKCARHINEATSMINDYLKTVDGAKYIDNKFKTCVHIDIKNKKDITQFFNNLAIPIALAVQNNNNNRYYADTEQMSSITISSICSMMLDRALGNSLERYADVHRRLRSATRTTCTPHVYQAAIKAFKETSWNSQYLHTGDRQWLYQSCTELGHFATSHQDNNLFGNIIPLKYFTDKCSEVFGKSYNLNALLNAVHKANSMYTFMKKKTSRVIYLHGCLDPWKKLGLNQPQSGNSVSIVIEGVSHCADFYPSSSSDLPQLTKARKTVLYNLKKWLSENDN